MHGQDDLLRAYSDLFSNIYRQFGMHDYDFMEMERSYLLSFFAV